MEASDVSENNQEKQTAAEAVRSPETSLVPDIPPAPAFGDEFRSIDATRVPSDLFETVVFDENPPFPSELEARFKGYEILSELGRGGMGVVYRARHIATGDLVALKTLQQLSADGLYRFKREFRVVAGLSHPNLITLRELVWDGFNWFITMDLLDGLDLLHYVLRDTESNWKSGFGQASPLTSDVVLRLRESLCQLVDGVNALHLAGVIHRDIKPHNVLVSSTGQVVLLDFGLAGEVSQDGVYRSSTGTSGTVGYMAPEQAAGSPITPAADWYAVGVVLYELLTGRLPFSGSLFDVWRNKQNSDPPSPSEFRRDLPEDLTKLCVELLHRDPTRRPAGPEIRERLANASPIGILPRHRPLGLRLIGRDDQLAMLHEGANRIRHGATVCACIHGPSGVGKSTLSRVFLEQMAEDGALTLVGRCYEQEQIPYKAFDGVIDALARHLASLPHRDCAALLPRDPGALRRLFAVMDRVPGISEAASHRADVPDPQEARRRGFVALREMLARLGDRCRLIILVDDFQWGDPDSAVLLEELVRPPDPPSLMLVFSYRSEDVRESPLLSTVRKLVASLSSLDVFDISVDSLTLRDARALAESLLGESEGASDARAEFIANQARGNPFYVAELAEASRSGVSFEGESSLERLLWDRSRGLPSEAQRLLELVSVAGRPISEELAYRAVGAKTSLHSVQSTLRARRLLRSIKQAEQDKIAPYHDRVREAVLSFLPSNERSRCHLNLAKAMENEANADAEFLAFHFHGAGEHRIAANYYLKAAVEAASATAFEQAARFYRMAADLGEWPRLEFARLRAREADALANAGRGATAGETYLAAATLVVGDESEDWRRQAAEQYLASGHFDTGLNLMREVVRGAGLPFPSTPLRAILGFLRWQVWLKIRGLGSKRCAEEKIPPMVLRRIDLCKSASIGLSLTDTICGAYFQTLGLVHSLQAGEPRRLSWALALYGAQMAADGPATDSKSGFLLDTAESILGDAPQSYSMGFNKLARGMREFLTGRFNNSVDLLGSAERIFLDSCTRVTWELDTAHTWTQLSYIFLGRWAQLAKEWPVLLQDARARGDLYAEVYLSTFALATVRLAEGEPVRALSEVQEAISRWSPSGFHVQHHNELVAKVLIGLYQGDGPLAWDLVKDKEKVYRRAILWRVQQVRTDFLQLRARSAIAAALHAGDPRSLVRSATCDAKKLKQESAPWANALGFLFDACLATLRPEASCVEPFATAAVKLEAADLGAFAAAARYRQGQATGGDAGVLLCSNALAWLKAQGVRDPIRIIDSHAPIRAEGGGA